MHTHTSTTTLNQVESPKQGVARFTSALLQSHNHNTTKITIIMTDNNVKEIGHHCGRQKTLQRPRSNQHPTAGIHHRQKSSSPDVKIHSRKTHSCSLQKLWIDKLQEVIDQFTQPGSEQIRSVCPHKRLEQ